jgi:membrane-associated phospholipid phosphatase/MFS family permease
VTAATARFGRRRLLFAFALAAVGAGAARALTTTYLPVLLERIEDSPSLIGVVMMVNAVAGFGVPIVVGIWSDRRGRRLPFIVGGAIVSAGGLVAVALGNASSYIALGLSASLVYVGLNALTTGHRAIVADDIEDSGRPAATSAQEIAQLAGAVIAVAIGGALIEPAPAAAFALAALVLAVTAVPTAIVTRRLRLGERGVERRVLGQAVGLRELARQPGARETLVAQTLWVFGYAALPAFFVLYAEHSLGLGVGAAGALPLAFGALTAVGIVLAGRAAAERVHGLLVTGAMLLGGGLLAAAPASSVAPAAPAFALAAVGAGFVTALGFPYFARFVPNGQAGRYSGVFFAARAVASAAVLPLAGLAVELTGSYRAVLWFGAAALAAVVPLVAAQRRAPRVAPALHPRPATVGAVMPVFASDRVVDVARATLRHVDELVLVDDGAPPRIARLLDELEGEERVRVVRMPTNGGKGTAVATGAAALLARPTPPEALLVIDSDGQHDPERIPAFIDGSRHADVVIGDRRDRRAMPFERRIARRAASVALFAATRAWLPDTQNGMRLFRAPALAEIPLPGGGYEAENEHLRALVKSGRAVESVEIPTIYDGEPSHFRPVVDTLRVARALIAPAPRADGGDRGAREAFGVLREWTPRLSALILAVIALGAAMPLVQPLDSALMLAINGLGDGPEWLYQAFDPHTRNYLLLLSVTVIAAAVHLRRARYVLGAALGVVLAAYLAGAALELVKLFVERARPEEVLGSQIELSHDRSWAHLASFPSGHLIVTSAMATAAASAVPALRRPLIAYVAMVALTRVLFGAHFPIDVLVGVVVGHELGTFTARLLASGRLLPATTAYATAGPASTPSTRRFIGP